MFLIFDCDGVVVDSSLLHSEVEADAYRSIGITISQIDLIQRFSGFSPADVDKVLEQETGKQIPKGFAAEIDEQKKRVFSERLKPVPGIVHLLRDGPFSKLPRCIASGTNYDLLIHSLKITGCYSLFEPNIFSSEMVLQGKPHPDLFLYAFKESKAYRTETIADSVVIEDGASGILAAKAAGMRAFGFIGGSHGNAELGELLLAAGAELVFSNLSELPCLLGTA